jgi:3-hydroxyisobutyrate dehydrogenase
MATPVIGFIGLGQMGLPMAARLAANGYTLVVHDADIRRADLLTRERQNVSIASGLDSWRGVDILVTMLPNSAVVEAVSPQR